MNAFKITNTTNLLGKRDYKYNSTLNIEYVDKMIKKTITIKPGNTVYVTLYSLPISIHRLRVKNLISVIEISNAELLNAIEANKPPIEINLSGVDSNVGITEEEYLKQMKKKLSKKDDGEL